VTTEVWTKEQAPHAWRGVEGRRPLDEECSRCFWIKMEIVNDGVDVGTWPSQIARAHERTGSLTYLTLPWSMSAARGSSVVFWADGGTRGNLK